MENIEKEELLQDFKTKLLRLNTNFKFLCGHVANSNGYSLNYLNLLYFISENEGMTLAGLAESIDMDKGNLSRLLNEQIREGYVEKKMDRQDNRKIHVFITEVGSEKIKELNKICITNLDHLLKILPNEEFTNFISTLDKLDNHFSNYAKVIKDGELQV
ncbi:MarR family winged helix-turn-helix transcriptional regulator [Mammaliicoccus sciuri]|uniref:MarR family winged helix-turn-helix transcriptional regulator n=1 Tax=Mammaliicoccus sciuri TaxID=1296 RepID=UPI001304CE46|nr:MarR family winged helix-turn-helix transcriptional regulator [Mammaliicoccus sciuri]MCD8897134.1 MarR family winged helix-turn-helix transcriptional regulator [Mammaliicoccus sciuri]MEB7769369.1 MarR family winged helix-turn-helix transcriptional regulator [Mammaliicoccus sciuri]MEB7819474.1 MarR family winged helix-turn-helix transcriptional regulator [Mammaliicoccus sciuri]